MIIILQQEGANYARRLELVQKKHDFNEHLLENYVRDPSHGLALLKY